MFIIDSERIKCKFCLQILKPEEIRKTKDICVECSKIIFKSPDLSQKMDQHILTVKNFVQKYSPSEINLEMAKSFLGQNHSPTHDVIYTKGTIDYRYIEMMKSGIKITGELLVAAFIPRVVEIVKYSCLKKVKKITFATNEDKIFLQNYWREHYSFDLPEGWDYVIHISFIQRNKTEYHESVYSFPSCVIEKFYAIISDKPIPELFSEVQPIGHFPSKFPTFKALIQLDSFQILNDSSNVQLANINQSLIVATDQSINLNNEYLELEDEEYFPIRIRNNYYYINKEDGLITTISYFEAEHILLMYLIEFYNKNGSLPNNITISQRKRTKHTDYIRINVGGLFCTYTYLRPDNIYNISNIYNYLRGEKNPPSINVSKEPVLKTQEVISAKYAKTSLTICNQCSNIIEKGQITINYKIEGKLIKRFHHTCADLSVIRNQINIDDLKKEDHQNFSR